jgi:hypothetical protein
MFEVFTAVTMKNDVFWDIKTQFVPHRRHIISQLESSVAFCLFMVHLRMQSPEIPEILAAARSVDTGLYRRAVVQDGLLSWT